MQLPALFALFSASEPADAPGTAALPPKGDGAFARTLDQDQTGTAGWALSVSGRLQAGDAAAHTFPVSDPPAAGGVVFCLNQPGPVPPAPLTRAGDVPPVLKVATPAGIATVAVAERSNPTTAASVSVEPLPAQIATWEEGTQTDPQEPELAQLGAGAFPRWPLDDARLPDGFATLQATLRAAHMVSPDEGRNTPGLDVSGWGGAVRAKWNIDGAQPVPSGEEVLTAGPERDSDVLVQAAPADPAGPAGPAAPAGVMAGRDLPPGAFDPGVQSRTGVPQFALSMPGYPIEAGQTALDLGQAVVEQGRDADPMPPGAPEASASPDRSLIGREPAQDAPRLPQPLAAPGIPAADNPGAGRSLAPEPGQAAHHVAGTAEPVAATSPSAPLELPQTAGSHREGAGDHRSAEPPATRPEQTVQAGGEFVTKRPNETIAGERSTPHDLRIATGPVMPESVERAAFKPATQRHAEPSAPPSAEDLPGVTAEELQRNKRGFRPPVEAAEPTARRALVQEAPERPVRTDPRLPDPLAASTQLGTAHRVSAVMPEASAAPADAAHAQPAEKTVLGQVVVPDRTRVAPPVPVAEGPVSGAGMTAQGLPYELAGRGDSRFPVRPPAEPGIRTTHPGPMKTVSAVSAPLSAAVSTDAGETVKWAPEAVSFPEMPGSTASTAPGAGPAFAPGQLAGDPGPPRIVVGQLAEAFRSGAESPVELTLQPEELGRVRMVFRHDGGALAVSLSAERPEILDLLRRNIELLAEEMRAAGYGEVSFAFGQGGDGPDRREQAPDLPGPETVHEASDTLPAAPRPSGIAPAVTEGMDIRL